MVKLTPQKEAPPEDWVDIREAFKKGPMMEYLPSIPAAKERFQRSLWALSAYPITTISVKKMMADQGTKVWNPSPNWGLRTRMALRNGLTYGPILPQSQFHKIAEQNGQLVVGTMTEKPRNRVEENLPKIYKCRLEDYREPERERYEY